MQWPVRPRFGAGQTVRVLDLGKPGHIRTPAYVREKVGIVLEACGSFLNPEDLSVGNCSGPIVPLYRVGFSMCDLWPSYTGPMSDRLFVEVYDHWLADAAPDQGSRLAERMEDTDGS